MKTLFDEKTRMELVARIDKLNERSSAQWGKMTAYQMIKHCAKWEDMLLGKTVYKQSLLGKVIGKFALKDIMKNEPLKPNLPTVPSFKIIGSGEVAVAKKEWPTYWKSIHPGSPRGLCTPFLVC
ncbi:hypothetical protein [Mucilaginibacter sp. SP1R1]|uniref:hypothetical protein n=1 Tax=Mucilaginibacter sp. SP1R1 TaxID=2723091 RepID=UPI0018223DFE|nr:hypothetical protein [Mucilaginibacter sp. SP1R1]MBB6148401.1 hypothetical protein [Mucilaginibacter sp. SP1R1]